MQEIWKVEYDHELHVREAIKKKMDVLKSPTEMLRYLRGGCNMTTDKEDVIKCSYCTHTRITFPSDDGRNESFCFSSPLHKWNTWCNEALLLYWPLLTLEWTDTSIISIGCLLWLVSFTTHSHLQRKHNHWHYKYNGPVIHAWLWLATTET